jgi:hypothetical protein
MKIAFYIDPFISPTSTFYTLILLQQELAKHNHELVFHIPNINHNTTANEDCYINRYSASKYGYEIVWNFPDPIKYDILFVVHIWSKKWNKRIDTRKDIANKFLKLNKKVLCLKVDTTMEHRFITQNILYGTNSNFKFDLSDHWTLPNNAKTFTFHQIANYKFEKPNALNKDAFYEKYGLNKDKKIITFFMSRYKKWHNNKLKFVLPIYWFLNNLKIVTKVLHKLNYQLVFKLHRSDGQQIINKYKIDRMVIIDNYDTYELIKYSSRAISFGTTMVYELYLYNLPVMEIGNGVYYPGWLSYISKIQPSHSPLSKYHDGQKLIYGTIVPYKVLIKKFELIMKTFIETEYDINKYKYLKKHPIYGNSYNATIESINQQLLTVL